MEVIKSAFKILASLIISISFLFETMLYSTVFAQGNSQSANKSQINSQINIDGDFNDWSDKPYVTNDESTNADNNESLFQELGYYSDNDYLYIHVTKRNAQKSIPWHFAVIILNAEKGKALSQPPLPYEPHAIISAPQFDVNLSYDSNKSNALVEVSLNGEIIESTYSASTNSKELEFKVPLAKVGLDGFDKQVKFILKSDPDKFGTVYWIPSNVPIIITKGPTLPDWVSIIFFLVGIILAYKIYSKNKTSQHQAKEFTVTQG